MSTILFWNINNKPLIDDIVALCNENEVDILKTFVDGDIKGRDVKIGPGTEVRGEVFFINSIVVSPRAILAKEPIQISDK